MLISLCRLVIIMTFLFSDPIQAGTYLNSAHGNSEYGVKRGSAQLSDYSRGNCAHCHEMHAMIDGVEPPPPGVSVNPGGVAEPFCLFYDYASQTDSFCFECHDNTTGVSAGAIINRSYSYRSGGWNADTLDDILEAFTNPPSLSSHNLGNIRTFITGKWDYTVDSNPCSACHNPHAVQGDPAELPNAAKSSATRGYPVARPSLHTRTDNDAWGLWGDEVGEKMSNYTGAYQAPYRFNSVAVYEPDGSATTNGSNLTDYVTFCTDCHNNTNLIYSTPLGRPLKMIDWDVEKHGKGVSDGPDGAAHILNPYSTNKVLACTDCHEPHGAPNLVLVRKEVNGGVLSGNITTITTTGNRELSYLCERCHLADGPSSEPFSSAHHEDVFPQSCGGPSPDLMCHGIVPDDFINHTCSYCHYHGSVVSDANGSRRTF